MTREEFDKVMDKYWEPTRDAFEHCAIGPDFKDGKAIVTVFRSNSRYRLFSVRQQANYE